MLGLAASCPLGIGTAWADGTIMFPLLSSFCFCFWFPLTPNRRPGSSPRARSRAGDEPWEFVSVSATASGSCRLPASRLSCRVTLSQRLSLLLSVVTVVTAPHDLDIKAVSAAAGPASPASSFVFKRGEGRNDFQLAPSFLKHDGQADTLFLAPLVALEYERMRGEFGTVLVLTGRAKKRPCHWLNSGISAANAKPRC